SPSWHCAFLLQKRWPVDDHRQRLARLSRCGAHEEALPIWGCVIGTVADIRYGQREQLARGGRLHGICAHFQAGHHSLVILRHVRKLAPARASLRISAAARRNLKFATRLRKSQDVDLKVTGHVRLVRHPARGRFRRETTPTLVERRPKKRLRSAVWRGSS